MNRYSCGRGVKGNTRRAIWMAGMALTCSLPGAWAQAAPSGANAVADAPSKSYRLTYTITEGDGGKPVGTQHLSILVFSGRMSRLKEGSKVPVSTSTYNAGSPTQNNQVQYLDVGLNMEASLIERADRLILSTKLEQSSVAEEKSPTSTQDPVIRQTIFEDTSLLTPGKPVVLGSVDIPGTTRRLDVEVVPELVR